MIQFNVLYAARRGTNPCKKAITHQTTQRTAVRVVSAVSCLAMNSIEDEALENRDAVEEESRKREWGESGRELLMMQQVIHVLHGRFNRTPKSDLDHIIKQLQQQNAQLQQGLQQQNAQLQQKETENIQLEQEKIQLRLEQENAQLEQERAQLEQENAQLKKEKAQLDQEGSISQLLHVYDGITPMKTNTAATASKDHRHEDATITNHSKPFCLCLGVSILKVF